MNCTRIPAVLYAFFTIVLGITTVAAAAETPFGFFRYPATDGKTVVFTSEGDLWRVPLNGGTAVRLTTHEGEERYARFSPDGAWIAFSAQDDAQDDVYLIPSVGGEPRRLTYHPDRDQVVGWDRDGQIVFRSTRDIPYRGYRLYRIPREGGWLSALPLDKAAHITFEPNGPRVAFNVYFRENATWKRYKGGWAQDVWVGDLSKLEFKNVTDNPPVNEWDGMDAFPMWHNDGRIYFLSDRNGRGNIYSMRPDGSDLKQLTFHKDFDARWPSLGAGIIVYQHGMDVWAYEIATNKNYQVIIQLPSDRQQAREKFVNPMQFISDYELSPDGKRLLLGSRGELFTVPSKGKGLLRQLTYTSGIREKAPGWSPDGKTIAAWSDASGEEQLYLYPAEGGDPKLVGTDKRGWHFHPAWSPDGKRVAYGNEELELVVMDIESGKIRVVDTGAWEITDYVWSPDSHYLAYSRSEPNYNRTIQIWDSKEGKVFPVTDDFFSSSNPVFDPEGQYLYFFSDRTANPHLDGQEMTYILDRRTQIFAAALKKGTASPFAPLADPRELEEEEHGKNGDADKGGKDSKDKTDKEEKAPEPVIVVIDFDGLSTRIVPFPVSADNYFNLRAVKGKVFYQSYENEGMLGTDLFEDEHKEGFKLYRFDIKKQKARTIADDITGYDISRNGEKLLLRTKDAFTVIGVDEEPGGGEEHGKDEDKDNKNVDLTGWDLRVDVRAEWKQMFYEAWRLQRDFFWDPNMHGVDWKAVRDQYGTLADRISTRGELNDLIGEMLAELNCSHTYIWGGDTRRVEGHSTGLLGVDLTRDPSGFYRINRVIPGRPWLPDCSSPLAAPGIDAKSGDYIVAINGRSTAQVPDYLELLLDKAGQITSVTLNGKPTLDGGREVIVKPLASEGYLRYNDWIDNRRAYVTEKSGGKLGYIHLTDMGGTGLSQFTQDYLPQHDKAGLIMDVRYNGGGFVAPMILSHLGRKPFSFGKPRHGSVYREPYTAFYGYIAAICNGETGSDGETFTEGFKRLGLGPVIGTRTWGGWVGIRGDKPFMDGGMVTEPEFTGWGLDRQWLIEGHGTDPDIPVEEDPSAYARGQDPQLDATIKYLLDKIAREPMPIPEAPPIPDRSLKMQP